MPTNTEAIISDIAIALVIGGWNSELKTAFPLVEAHLERTHNTSQLPEYKDILSKQYGVITTLFFQLVKGGNAIYNKEFVTCPMK